MNKSYQIQLTPKQTLKHLTRISAGLVASGQFTVDPDLDYMDSIAGAIAATAVGVLRKLTTNIEDEINEGDTDRYILHHIDVEEHRARLAEIVERQPGPPAD